MIAETILTNATLVLPHAVILGTLVLRNGQIADLQPGLSALPAAQDLGGDFLLPGLVDLHTDNLERQVQPRANARWPSRSALVAHDAQCAAAGVTTVLDALCIGDLGFEQGRIQTCQDGIADLDALGGTGLLKSCHFLHLRCELPAPDMLESLAPIAGHPLVRMASLMDHTPGAGQYADLDYFRRIRGGSGTPAAEIESLIATMQAQRARMSRPNRAGLLELFAGRGIALASHDDDSAEQVAENAAAGIAISEFPTTLEAARATRQYGIQVIAGAPNLVRGGSHSGNVGAGSLLEAGLVDAFASDYVPPALLEAAFLGPRHGVALPAAVAMVSDVPARLAGLEDRGRIAPGRRADLVQVRLHGDLPVVRVVWSLGQRVI